MNKEITFHINNLAYSITIDERLESKLTQYIDISKNLSTKELLFAYLKLSQDYVKFEEDVEKISQKLVEFE